MTLAVGGTLTQTQQKQHNFKLKNFAYLNLSLSKLSKQSIVLSEKYNVIFSLDKYIMQ